MATDFSTRALAWVGFTCLMCVMRLLGESLQALRDLR